MYPRSVKPFLDVVTSLLLLLLFSPLFLLITIILMIINKGKPFFIHERPGKEEVIIRMLKFRTMTDDKSGKRISGFGRFLRKTSLDELPQLINVLKLEMSIVGPRPLHKEYLTLYSKEQYRRQEVRPGITGWAQVNGRNTITWQQRFDYDVWYVDHMSFFLDLKILFMTIIKVVKGEGINQPGHLTCEKFTGNPEEPVGIDEQPFKKVLKGNIEKDLSLSE